MNILIKWSVLHHRAEEELSNVHAVHRFLDARILVSDV